MTPRPFQFLADAGGVMNARALAELARRAEAAGYHGLVVSDHLVDKLAPVPAMAVIAATSDRLRMSAFVFNNDFRHPAVLAQDLASLDVLSDGRLDIGIGAGWRKVEYDGIGMTVRAGARSARQRLAEAVAVLKGLFADEPLTLRGEPLPDQRAGRAAEAGAAPASAVPDRGRRDGARCRWPVARPRSSDSRRASMPTAAATRSASRWRRPPRRSTGCGKRRRPLRPADLQRLPLDVAAVGDGSAPARRSRRWRSSWARRAVRRSARSRWPRRRTS